MQDTDQDTPRKSKFPTTRWTIVRELGNGSRHVRFPAWEEFFHCYREPLYLWLLGKTRCPTSADELVQSFFVKLNGNTGFPASLDGRKGLLRSWLLTCLRNHWVDSIRARGHHTLPLDSGPDPVSPAADDSAYDREWAFALARRVTSALRDEYIARGKPALFDSLILSLSEPEDTDRAAICEKFSMTENHYAVCFMRFRERLAVLLRQEVAATIIADDPGETDAELRHLIAILARNGGFP